MLPDERVLATWNIGTVLSEPFIFATLLFLLFLLK